MKYAVVIIILLAAITTLNAQVQVFVPGNASGYFGNPADQAIPFVPALTVNGPGTITVTYVSGTVTDAGGVNTGPDGTTWNNGTAQTPLQEAKGIAGGTINNLDALIGAFVPAVRANHSGFAAIDGTKDATRVGIIPHEVFFIGESITFAVTEAGTLYLGINDWVVSDNSGGFNVTVSVQ